MLGGLNDLQRSVFIEYPDRAAAIDAIVALTEGTPVRFVVVGITDFTADGDGISVFYSIAADTLTEEGRAVETVFIDAAGGEYTGS